jgi:predicted DNA-binding protein (MmcQ/YjbR family)
MDIESFREYCLGLKGVSEEFPFDQKTLVFKVMGKMFALTDIDYFESINLKCIPEQAVLLREQYPEVVLPGYHMNKAHWNTVLTKQNALSDHQLKVMILDSYNLVKEGLPKKIRQELDKETSP